MLMSKLKQCALAVVCFAPLLVQATPQTGWWWNPAESGRGFFVESENGVTFIGAYLYDDDFAPRGVENVWKLGKAVRRQRGAGALWRGKGGEHRAPRPGGGPASPERDPTAGSGAGSSEST